MATARQINANRKNAKRSSGPTTAAGKTKVRYNAMKHGLLAEAALLPDEDEATFRDFSARIRTDLRPVGEMESILADRITNILWRLRRFNHVETGLFVREGEADDTARRDVLREGLAARRAESRLPPPPAGRPSAVLDKVEMALLETSIARINEAEEARSGNPRQRLGDAFAHDAATGNAFSKLARYETHLNRTLERTLKQLHDLQQDRARKVGTS
jgi:hypothetical protein